MAMAKLRVFSWTPERVLDHIDQSMADRMVHATAIVEADVKASMVGGGSPHVPSAPGEPPHIDTGDYRRRIHSDIQTQHRRVVGRVISGSVQAMALEFGYAPHNLAARPHLRPALQRNLARLRQILGAPVSGLVSRGGR